MQPLMSRDAPSWIDRWCRAHLGAGVSEILFVTAHLSEVVGVRLETGQSVVVKRRADDHGRARSCVSAQRLLAERGFPCPLPLTETVVVGGAAVHAEQFLAGGDVETEETPAAAARSAALFAEMTRLLASVEIDPPLPNPEWVRWDSPPERHTSSTAPDWLESTSRRVREKLVTCQLPRIAGHGDWEAQNMRWQDGEPFAVHDWDSLAWLPEAALAGTAAGVFASHGPPILAPVESSAAFLDAYQHARGAPFGADEQELAWAASLWVALHNARDEVIFDRPRLSLSRLEGQRDERLALAGA
jgi:hypothetical protein